MRIILKDLEMKMQASSKTLVDALKTDTTLGTGTFGRVRLCHLRDDVRASIAPLKGAYSGMSPTCVPKVFALKIMKKLEVVRLKQVEHIRNEKAILELINHPFLVTQCALPRP